ncbi:MAG: hypothetical protein DSY76_09455 [Bacteroidetes bacterium]|nr:MAG: hypothetical protein DSY76_09455 [Bacteroidota bacterium]
MNLSKKQEYLIIAGLLVLIFPFFALLLYVHPQGDDFFFAAKVNEMGVLPFVKDMYLHWSGRYASMFIGAFDPVIYKSLHLLRFELLLLLIFNIFSVFLFIKSVLKNTISNRKIVLITLVIYTILLNSIPDIFEFMYWFPSVTAYQLGLSLLLIFIANIFFKKQKRISPTFYLTINAIIVLIAIGLLELFIIPFILTLLLNIYINLRSKQLIKYDIIILILSILSSLILLAGPGNYVRLQVANSSGFIVGLYLAAKSMIYLMGYLFQNPTFTLGSILFIAISNKYIHNTQLFSFEIPRINPIIILIANLGIPYLILLPSTIALISLPAGRIFNIAAFVFTFLWLFSLLVFQKHYYGKFTFEMSSFYKSSLALLMLMFVFSGVYIINPYEFAQKKNGSVLISGNILKAYNTLLFEAKPFDEDMIKRYKSFSDAKKNNKKTLIVKPLEHHPEMLIFVDIADIQSPGTWIFNWEAKYYGMDSICIEKDNVIIKDKIKQEIQQK